MVAAHAPPPDLSQPRRCPSARATGRDAVRQRAVDNLYVRYGEAAMSLMGRLPTLDPATRFGTRPWSSTFIRPCEFAERWISSPTTWNLADVRGGMAIANNGCSWRQRLTR